MKNGLLICTGTGKRKNIGDFIQSAAQEQFFDHVDCYVEREHLDTFLSKEKVRVIMNGWFMWTPKNFPPSQWIEPLFVSMHIVPSIADVMLSEKAVTYLKKYEPIGARDFNTQKLLESKGINSYFSGCLTLTLGLKYKSTQKDDSIYFVDPYYELGNRKSGIFRYVNSLRLVVKYFKKARIISNSFVLEDVSKFSKISHKLDVLAHAASFYAAYSTSFGDEILLNAKSISHIVQQSDFNNDDEKMEYARRLIRKYANAKLVVTSRIHCALPCLGVETPVLFVNSQGLSNGEKRGGSNGRFGGLIELLNTLTWTKKGVINNFSDNIISMQNIPQNPDVYVPIKDKLIKTVEIFINNLSPPSYNKML